MGRFISLRMGVKQRGGNSREGERKKLEQNERGRESLLGLGTKQRYLI